MKVFENEYFGSIRSILIDEIPYFVGKDVASALAYTNPQKAIRDHVDDEDKTVNELFTVNGTQGILINESGVYSLVFSSKLPTAKKFKRWVTSEVLPSIRKTGNYQINNVDSYMIENPIERAKRWIEEQQEKIELMEKISYLEPKAKISDKRIDTLGCYSISDVNKSLHIKQGKLSRWAKFLGFIHKTQNEVNQKGDEYFKVYCKDGKHNQIGITEKGLELINKEIDTIRNIDQIINQ